MKNKKSDIKQSERTLPLLPGTVIIVVLIVLTVLLSYFALIWTSIVPAPPFLAFLFSDIDGGKDGLILSDEFINALDGSRPNIGSGEELILGDELPEEVLMGALKAENYFQRVTIEYLSDSSRRVLEVALAVSDKKYRVEITEDDSVKIIVCDGGRMSITENDKTVVSSVTPGEITPSRDAGIPDIDDIVSRLAELDGSVRLAQNADVLLYSSTDGETSRQYKIMFSGAVVLEAEYSYGGEVFYKLNTLSVLVNCSFEASLFEIK